ncbi:hypothetical protein OV203_38475 [Nannocystis sp. ILAH1]|uniref:DUF6896 domain-containing protein n=1 Tax=Nannocystis sp. ILAH1 TaxID=2996789 RepID=UPI002270D20A|nr:hypothetical protein [Nannocystis sp. ILAH1]MCY0993091.1 hypothetical protein [Nannocystis sp. ILAH1]
MNLMDLVRAIDGALAGRTVAPVASPWLAWLTLALMRQRARQVWHRRVVETLPDRHDEGVGPVPGQPGWDYRFHGIGCCLTGPDGELVDVDFLDDDAALIDPWFFAVRVGSIRERDLPERRLWHWLSHEDALIASLAELRDAAILDHPQGKHVFRLCGALEQRVAALGEVDFADPGVVACWLESLGDNDAPAVISAHRRWLSARASAHPRAYDFLPAAAQILTPDELLRVYESLLLAGPINASAGKAVELRCASFDPRGVPLVRRLLARVTIDDPPYPAYQCLAFLLEHDARAPGLRARFIEFAAVERAAGFLGNPFLGKYAILALRYIPDLALGLVRRALRSTTPMARADIADMLAAIDQPWCHRELEAARAECPAGADEDDLDDAEELGDDERRVALELRTAYPADWKG